MVCRAHTSALALALLSRTTNSCGQNYFLPLKSYALPNPLLFRHLGLLP